MKKKNVIVYLAIAILITGCNSKSGKNSNDKINESKQYTYIPGGRNVEIFRYQYNIKNPPFPDKARFIGLLKGSWYEIGKQYGEQGSEYILYVTDHFWNQFCSIKDYKETIKAIKLYE